MIINKEVLENGATLITASIEGVNSTSIFYFVKAGSRQEDRENNGVAHFMEHMMFKGTQKRPTALDISREIDEIGAIFNAFTSKEETAYYVKAAGQHVPKALDVLSDMVLNSKFDEKELNKEKGVIIEEIKMYKDNPSWHLGILYDTVIFKNSTLGHSTLGTKENIQSFDRDVFQNFYDNHYFAGNIILVLAGNLEHEGGKAKEFLAKFKNSDVLRMKSEVTAQERSEFLLEYRDIEQGHFQFGTRGVPYNSASKYELSVLSIILGGPMSSRLFSEVREKRGLAYSIRTATDFLSDTGEITTVAGVEKSKIYDALKLVLEQYQIISEDLTEDELNLAKEYYKGTLTISLEDTSKLATVLATQNYYLGKTMDLDQIISKIEAVTLKGVKSLASQTFKNQKLNLAVIGPYKNEEKFGKIIDI